MALPFDALKNVKEATREALENCGESDFLTRDAGDNRDRKIILPG
jgi:hypothetical protein